MKRALRTNSSMPTKLFKSYLPVPYQSMYLSKYFYKCCNHLNHFIWQHIPCTHHPLCGKSHLSCPFQILCFPLIWIWSAKVANLATYIHMQIITINNEQQWSQHWFPWHTTLSNPPVWKTILYHHLLSLPSSQCCIQLVSSPWIPSNLTFQTCLPYCTLTKALLNPM